MVAFAFRRIEILTYRLHWRRMWSGDRDWNGNSRLPVTNSMQIPNEHTYSLPSQWLASPSLFHEQISLAPKPKLSQSPSHKLIEFIGVKNPLRLLAKQIWNRNATIINDVWALHLDASKRIFSSNRSRWEQPQPFGVWARHENGGRSKL